jgi:hypothetical protein
MITVRTGFEARNGQERARAALSAGDEKAELFMHTAVESHVWT